MSGTQRSRASRLTTIGGLVGLVAFTATGCSGSEVLRFGWPEGVTPQSERMVDFWTWTVIASLVVGVIMWALILWPVIAHRKKGDALPRQFQYNHFLEFIYTGIPSIIVVVLFYFTVTTQNFVLAEESEDNVDVNVGVLAFQWNWQFTYNEYATADGRTVVPRTSDGELVTTTGSTTEIPLLVLPAQKTIHYDLRARDVIHSFFVPEFHFKRDVFPYPEKNNQDNTFQNSIDREGSFVGRCAELCGTYHSGMNFEVRALSPERFDDYMQLRVTTNENTGKPFTAAEALARMGEDDPSCGELCSPTAVTTSPFNSDRTARTSSN
ncbi:aa3-type cytochrome oxidase subunit II [Actinophytocola algeriensis]|uniref:Cytochrome c oxidase subunit 2 n=1 Tax=Actinophytocola algeriensis TaxID=1768010 RepID=A0A7W7Q0M3_9PSEU|nr:cytochrome c oxidase subunit II [Actinophytocola algeriensis]MBB4904780.1 cytochrome c oxidase subunit 2 [Actinophytocola algeriensis]MBE1476361.1 cytochrome c oxidase subunit 2 [Actinophytocola algeriensis]